MVMAAPFGSRPPKFVAVGFTAVRLHKPDLPADIFLEAIQDGCFSGLPASRRIRPSDGIESPSEATGQEAEIMPSHAIGAERHRLQVSGSIAKDAATC
jgi:hypothetical protein